MSTNRQTITYYLKAALHYPKQFWGAVILWPIGLTLQNLIGPLFIARALNCLVHLDQSADINYIQTFAPYVIGFILVSAIGQMFIYISLLCLTYMETNARQYLEKQIYTTLLDQSLHFHNNTFSGSLVTQTNRFTGSFVAIADAVFIRMIEIFVMFVIALFILSFYAPLIAAVMFIWTLCFLFINFKLTKKRVLLSRIAARADSKITGQLADSLGNVSTVKAFAHESEEEKSFMKLSRDRGMKKSAAWIHAIRTGSATAGILLSLNLFVLFMSIIAISQNKIDIGTLVLIQVYMGAMISSLWGFGATTKNIEQSLSDATEMSEILQLHIDVVDIQKPSKLLVTNGAINFKNVSFIHDGQKRKLFNGFNLDIKPGEKVGLVGPSGGGKTSLTKLLLRFNNIDEGTIEIDDQDIGLVSQRDLRSAIAYVPQEPMLFHRSLQDNISYGKPDATLEEIKVAAKNAHADVFIDDLPFGYETLVGERGVKLSGGQRQRVAIARAMLKNAHILLLDEATSALDSESESLIQDALWKLMENRTAIVIAHRLSTIQKMDRIVVLDNGVIAEQGSHTELLKHSGVYAKLWAHQSGGFIQD